MLRSFLFPLKAPATRQRGFSLVELMVGITVGLIVIATVALVFATSSRARREMAKTAQQVENGRYASQVLIDDFRLAGYYGELNPTTLTPPYSPLLSMPDPCATALATLNGMPSQLLMPVQGYDNAATIPSCLLDVKAGTDIVAIRRTSTCVAGTSGCDPVNTSLYTYFQTHLCATQILPPYVIGSSGFTGTQMDCVTPAVLRSYYTRIYFVANNNQPNDGIPTLKVAELGSGSFIISPLVAGIDQMQIEYGVETTVGQPAVYTANPSTYNGCSSATCQIANWENVITAKIHILARNTQSSQAFTDTRTYVLGKLADGVTNNVYGPFNDAYKRHVYTTVVRLNNVAGRRGE